MSLFQWRTPTGRKPPPREVPIRTFDVEAAARERFWVFSEPQNAASRSGMISPTGDLGFKKILASEDHKAIT